MRLLKLLSILIIISPLTYCQTKEWVNFYGRSEVNCLAIEGQYLWAGNATNLTKLNTLTGEVELFDSLNSGLPRRGLLSIAIDSQGNKWIGTDGGGLVRFNNNFSTVYNMSGTGLSSNVIHSVAIDKQDNKWIGTNNGLVKYDGHSWVVYNKSNSGLPDTNITAIAIDQKGNKWIGTKFGGLAKFNDTTWTIYDRSNSGIPDIEVISLAIDRQDNVWVGTFVVFHVKGGLSKFDGKNWTVYSENNSYLPNEPTTAIAVDQKGNIWSGSRGLIKFDGNYWTVKNTHNSSIPSDAILSIAIDPQGNKWFGTNTNIVKYDDNNFTSYSAANSGLPGNNITSIVIDRENTKWFGAGVPGGVTKYDNQNWTFYNPVDYTYPGIYPAISSIAIDTQNVKWIGSLYGGLIRFDDKTWVLYDRSNSGLPDNNVIAIAADKQGNKWIITSIGLVKYDNKTWVLYNSSNSVLPDNSITSIAIDQSGNKWIGTSNKGLVKYDDKSWMLYNTSNSGLPDNFITAISVDQMGNKWIGTENSGLVKYNDSVWTVYNTSNSGLISNHITAIAFDRQGNKWIAEGNYYYPQTGLAKFDNVVWTTYKTSNSGLTNDNINSIAADLFDNKWIGTAIGLSVFREGGVIFANLPYAPKLLSVANNSKDQPLDLALSWEKVNNADTYRLQLSIDSLFKNIVLNDSNLTSPTKSVIGLTEGRIYYWRVNSKNNLGSSQWSDIWNFTTILYAPDSLKVKILSKAKLQLSWNDKSGTESGFIIERNNSKGFSTIDTTKANATNYIDSTAEQFILYQYRIKAYNQYTVSAYSNIASIAITGINGQKKIPAEYSLSQNYPNPFNPVTKIKFTLPLKSYVTLKIFDILGHEVISLLSEEQSAGEYNVQFNASSLPSGIYIYTIQAGPFRDSKKLILIK